MTPVLRWLAVVLGAAAFAIYAATAAVALRVAPEEFVEGVIRGTAVLSWAVIGAFLAFRRPRHSVGWLLLMAGLGETMSGGSSLYGEYSAYVGRDLPLEAAVTWIGGSLWAFSAGALLVFLPLSFPTGRAPTPRWRWVGWLGWLAVGLLLLSTLYVAVAHSALMTLEWEAVEAALGDDPVFVISELGFPLLLAAGPVALLSLVVRFVRSRGEERQQIKLLVFAVSITVAFIIVSNVFDLPPVAEATGTALAMPSFGVATMVAVMRYRLFEIDRIVSRTVAYALLSLLLIGIYLAAVTVLTAIMAPVTRESPIAVAAATLLAAAVFQPARQRIQSTVDRRFNRARYDAHRTVESFASSLRQEVDLDDVHSNLLGTVGAVLQPAAVTVWLRRDAVQP